MRYKQLSLFLTIIALFLVCITAVSAQNFATNIANQTAWFKLDSNTSGVAIDNSPAGNNGAVATSVTVLTGQINNSYHFDVSKTEYVTLKTNDVNLTGPYVTYSGWIKPDDTRTGGHAIFSKLSGPYTNYLIIQHASTNANRFQVDFANNSNGSSLMWDDVITANVWQHFALVFNNTQVTLYINGSKVSTKTANAPLPVFTANAELASRSDDRTQGFNGSIDNFKVNNASATDEQILIEYYSGQNQGNYNLFTVNATNDYNATQITNHFATIGGTTYNANSVRLITNVTSGTIVNVTVGASGYVSNSSTNYNTSVDLLSYLSPTNHIRLTIKNELTEANIANSTIELIADGFSYNATLANGTLYLAPLTPGAYLVRYGAIGFAERFSYFILADGSNVTLSLYLLNSTLGTNVTATVYEQDGTLAQNALIKVLKYDLTTNSYVVREQLVTNFEGRATFDVQLNQEFYKFIVEYPVETIALTTDPSYIDSTAITLVVSTGIDGTEYRYVLGAAGALDFNYATTNFRFTWSDTNAVVTNSCVYAYKLLNNFTATLVNSSCSTASAGTILLAVDNTTGAQYFAKSYFTIRGVTYPVDEAWADLRTVRDWGSLGLVIAICLTVAISFIFLSNPTNFVLSLPVGITLTNIVGLTYFDFWVPMILWIVAIGIVYAMGRGQ